jgi:hypothetical protein
MKVLSKHLHPDRSPRGGTRRFRSRRETLVSEILGDVILPLLRDAHCYARLFKFR